ncbi:MAG: 4-alpha-glucanotransferase [Ruminococcaceae bacterium]|nr:4-alpha-glucanotransferase [Oscillospiraceae bacterium]
MNRCAGVLLPISSLPSRYGIGCFDESAYRFVDWLKAAGQSLWQILPLGFTGYGDSPYQSFSTFAGNPYFISLEEFVKCGVLTAQECAVCENTAAPDAVDYGRLYQHRYTLLRNAYIRSAPARDMQQFCSGNRWLEDYALFMAVKQHFGGRPLSSWDEDIRMRRPSAVARYTEELKADIGFYKFIQYHFFRQWRALKEYANKNGVRIIGDIPIYVAADSADVWAAPQLFQLDTNNVPVAVAGCPPDGFAADGQLWGNPLYDWDAHRATGYSWWISRLAHCFGMYDVVRIDHFRGFDEYYSIPYGAKNARNGHWEKGPGMALFTAVEKALGKRDVIAEDLGFVTDSVRRLVRDSGFPNMKVLQFAFDARDTGGAAEYMPHNYSENCVAYTGTHDNQTLTSWFDTITRKERQLAREYLCDSYTPQSRLNRSFISLIMRSRAGMCIVPMQDWLGLDDAARMNTPSTLGGNWMWRMKAEDMSQTLCRDMQRMTELYGRLPER